MRFAFIQSLAMVAGAGLLAGINPAPARAERTIEVSLRERYLTVLDGGKPIARYPVAIGAPETPTPPGSYSIIRKEAEPVYHKHGKVIAPGPKNPVGVRYMAYFQLGSGEYAIHGTAWPSWVKLRAAVSLGCIRMLNSDVIKVFNMVDIGTPVLVKAN